VVSVQPPLQLPYRNNPQKTWVSTTFHPPQGSPMLQIEMARKPAEKLGCGGAAVGK
jgi:hypothetical protein